MDPMQNDDREDNSALQQQIEELREQLATLQAAASERAQQAYAVVKDNPGTSILVAAAVAAILGFVAGQQAEAERHRHHKFRWNWN